MEAIERVRLLKTLKCGNDVWYKGKILDAAKDGKPIPTSIISEIRQQTGTVEVLPPPPRPRTSESLFCTYCEHEEFKTSAAMKAHITKFHIAPEPTEDPIDDKSGDGNTT